ncbi:hypothetical protein, partial [Methylobacterium tarhaniae]|uniref:hypothetical protein n=1 Tax=Methylobacterium tarhaniae TaxID=1187852 RepID=UPI000653FF9F
MAASPLHRFLVAKARTLKSRAHRLTTLSPATVGLRPQDLRHAPSRAHFEAANRRLASIDAVIRQRLEELDRIGPQATPSDRLLALAMVEREIDRARRSFGMFFEVFAQRGSAFAPALAAHDVIAADCYRAVRKAAPRIFSGSLLAPVTYLEHGYSPMTMRRGVTLGRLMGERNPFPLIRIPWDREKPWQATFLHEVAHNLQADLGIWEENQHAVLERLVTEDLPARAISIFGRWHKEIFADLAALLLGGPAVGWGMAEFLAHPEDKVMTYRPGGAHPTGLLRGLILAEAMRSMGFAREAEALETVWRGLYDPRRGHRIPQVLLDAAPRAIPAIVNEIMYQPRRNLSERSLARVIPFTAADQAAIEAAGRALVAGSVPAGLAPRFLVSACRYAFTGGADIVAVSKRIIAHLTREAAPVPARLPAAPAGPLPATRARP